MGLIFGVVHIRFLCLLKCARELVAKSEQYFPEYQNPFRFVEAIVSKCAT